MTTEDNRPQTKSRSTQAQAFEHSCRAEATMFLILVSSSMLRAEEAIDQLMTGLHGKTDTDDMLQRWGYLKQTLEDVDRIFTVIDAIDMNGLITGAINDGRALDEVEVGKALANLAGAARENYEHVMETMDGYHDQMLRSITGQ